VASLVELSEVAKAFPALGALGSRAASSVKPMQGAFMRGVKGRKVTRARNPRAAGATSVPTAGQLRANQAGLFVNRYRTPLTAVGAGGAAGAGAGYLAGRKKDG
jgi:hypothetical protein